MDAIPERPRRGPAHRCDCSRRRPSALHSRSSSSRSTGRSERLAPQARLPLWRTPARRHSRERPSGTAPARYLSASLGLNGYRASHPPGYAGSWAASCDAGKQVRNRPTSGIGARFRVGPTADSRTTSGKFGCGLAWRLPAVLWAPPPAGARRAKHHRSDVDPDPRSAIGDRRSAIGDRRSGRPWQTRGGCD